MTLEEIKEILSADVICGSENLKMEIKMGCGSDLMSDVLAFIKSGSLLLTGLTHPQVIYTAEISDIKAICLVRGKRPSEEMLNLAKTKNIPLLVTNLPMFESCGRLYKNGLVGCSEVNV
jgi:predicted transcriptional regulator